MNKIRMAILAIAVATPAAVWSQGIVYATGHSIDDQKIRLQPWGSGSIAETDETGYDGGLSVRVSFRNFFQGGSLILGTPVDLSQESGDKYSLFRVEIRVADSSMTLGGKGGGLAPGGPGGKPGGGVGAPGGPGGKTGGGIGAAGQGNGGDAGGALAGGAAGGLKGGGSDASTVHPLTMIRVVLTTTDGKKSEAYMPVDTRQKTDRGWIGAAIPLSAIRGFAGTNKTIKDVSISGDTTSTVYVGDVRVVTDTTPINGDVPSDSLNLAIGDNVELHASGYGGSTPLIYEWNFDSSHGNEVDAVGQFVNHRFRKAGSFIVTVTIADMYGLKKSYTKTIKVTVNA